MSNPTPDVVCIVGAGLSGARAAHALVALGLRVSLVDARPRVGGRLLTADEQGGGDLGGAWIWPRSEFAMHSLLRELGVPTVPMHLEGATVARTQDGERHRLPAGAAGRYAACGDGAVRVAGGAASIVEKLLEADDGDKLSVHLGTWVTRIEYDNNGVHIMGTKSQPDGEDEAMRIQCRAAILAAPPKVLASSIEFDPALPEIKKRSMISLPTWMEEYGKVSISFGVNWWRTNNLSAISIDQMGAVSTWWEACSGVDGDGSQPTLAGFVTSQGAEVLRKMESPESLFEYVLDSLRQLYDIETTKMGMATDATNIATNGSADKDGLVVSKGGITVTYKSWLEDPFTSVETPRQSGFACGYGDEVLKQSVGPLFFAGTETESLHGHMEGAVVAAQRAADEVTAFLDRQNEECANH